MKNEVPRKDGIGEYSSFSISISPLEAQIYPDCSVLFRCGVPGPYLADTAAKRARSSGVTCWLASDTGLPVSQKNGPSVLVVMIRLTTGSA